MSSPSDPAAPHPRRRPLVVARIFGGLGNQLFCYAAARRLALVSQADLALDDVSGFARDAAYRRQYQLRHFSIPCRTATPAERFEPGARVRRFIKRTLARAQPLSRRSYIRQEGMDFDARLLDVRARGTLHLEGYWQSERYFKDVEAVVRQDLRLAPPAGRENETIAEQMRQCNAVAVHVRFFDAPGGPELNNAPTAYYARALEWMSRRQSDAHYFVFTDQPAAALARLPRLERMTLVAHNEGDAGAVADLWLMTRCRHFIIANSTFSWWGAWLSEHAGKTVVAPGFEMRFGSMWWGFDGLLPEDWVKL